MKGKVYFPMVSWINWEVSGFDVSWERFKDWLERREFFESPNFVDADSWNDQCSSR